MWKRFLLRRRSVILTWLFSYLAILFVPLLISGFVYSRSQELLKSEIHHANNVLLQEVREVIDNQVDSVKRLTTELIWNVRLRAFMYSSLYSTPASLDGELYNLHIAAKDLAIYRTLYPSIRTYYVYWRNMDLIFEPGLYRNHKLAYETIHENDAISYEIWLNLLQRKNAGSFIKLASKDDKPSTLAYIQSFPGERLGSSPGTSVVLLDTTKLMETIRNVQAFSEGQVLVMNPEKQVLVSTDSNQQPLYLSNIAFEGQSGSAFEEYNGERSEFMYIKSSNSELIYATVVPSTLVWQKTDSLRSIMYIGMLVSIVGGLTLSALFLLRNYSPVQRLLRLLQTVEKKETAPVGDEFHRIQQAISDTLDEKGRIYSRMKQQSSMLRSNMLTRMLKGRMDNRLALDESLTAFDVHFRSEKFAVILFYVDDERFFEHIDAISVRDKARLLEFIVANVVEDLAGEKHQGFACEIDDNIACLINLTEGPHEGLHEDVREIALRASRFLEEKFRIDTLVSLSGIKSSRLEIAEAYREAVDAMEYRIVVGNGDLSDYDELRREEALAPPSDYYYPIQVEQQLINLIKAGEADGAEEIVRGLLSRSRERASLSVEWLKCLMHDLVGTLLKAVGEIGGPEDGLAARIAQLVNCESSQEMEIQLAAAVRETCEFALSRQKENSSSSRNLAMMERSQDILAFISANYREANLNISMIGERFGMTPTYLSKLFKDQTGQGLLDTINRFRIEEAKTLLRGTKESIKSVSSQVGFHDINTFIRTFKKYEGITPGQFQKLG